MISDLMCRLLLSLLCALNLARIQSCRDSSEANNIREIDCGLVPIHGLDWLSRRESLSNMGRVDILMIKLSFAIKIALFAKPLQLFARLYFCKFKVQSLGFRVQDVGSRV